MIKTDTVYTVKDILQYYDKSWDENPKKDSNSKEFLPTMKVYSPNLDATFDDGIPVWSMNYETAKNTFEYIYRLKTKVYIARINNGVIENYILFNPKGSPKELKQFLRNLDPDIEFTEKQKQIIKNREWKFMGCILQYEDESQQDLTMHRYYRFLELLNPELIKHIKNGLYIFSTRDLCLVHKRRVDPWIDVIGVERNDIGYIPKQFLPIFNSTGGTDYFDIPIPNFDDVTYVMNFLKGGRGKSYQELVEHVKTTTGPEDFQSLTTSWSEKKPVAVFRGSATGCGYSPENNVRLKLAKLAQDLNDKSIVDAGIVRGDSAREKYIFNRDTGLGFYKSKRYGINVVERLTKQQQSGYKYIIEIEGNVSAHRVLTDMLYKSLLLMVDSEYTLWYSHLLVPYVHYIPIKKDLSDLLEKITWCRNHDDLCEKMAINSYNFAIDLLKFDVITNTMGNLMIQL